MNRFSSISFAVFLGAVLLSTGKADAVQCTFGPGLPPSPPTPHKITSCTNGVQWPGATPPLIGWAVPPGPVPPPIVAGPNGYYKQWYETSLFGIIIPGSSFYSYYPTDKDVWFLQGPTDGSGTVTWYWDDQNFSGTWLIPPDPPQYDDWTLSVNFEPNFQKPLGSLEARSIFEYVTIIDKGQGGEPHLPFNDTFGVISLSAIFGNLEPNGISSFVEKEIWMANCTDSPSDPDNIFDSCGKGSFIRRLRVDTATINNTDSIDLSPFSVDKLYIVDTAVARDNTIDIYLNRYHQTPGPSPITGAVFMLRLSRKLRQRIKLVYPSK